MNGSVRKRGSTWSYRIDFGKAPDGKRNQIAKGGYKIKKEADKALNAVSFSTIIQVITLRTKKSISKMYIMNLCQQKLPLG